MSGDCGRRVFPAPPVQKRRGVHPRSVGRLVSDVAIDAGNDRFDFRGDPRKRFECHGLANLVRPTRPEAIEGRVQVREQTSALRAFLIFSFFLI
jgi:hypothetical protein